jgi:hypothetical protein
MKFQMRLTMVMVTIAVFLVTVWVNMAFFSRFEFAPGINWIYLPAGVRLLATLLFAEAGAIGLLLVSWGVSYGVFFPEDPTRAFVGGVVSAVAPYMVYRIARRHWGLESTLSNLTSGRLLLLAVLFSLASPALHHVWFAIEGQPELLRSFVAMFVGDLNGTLLVMYSAKLALRFVPERT